MTISVRPVMREEIRTFSYRPGMGCKSRDLIREAGPFHSGQS